MIIFNVIHLSPGVGGDVVGCVVVGRSTCQAVRRVHGADGAARLATVSHRVGLLIAHKGRVFLRFAHAKNSTANTQRKSVQLKASHKCPALGFAQKNTAFESQKALLRQGQCVPLSLCKARTRLTASAINRCPFHLKLIETESTKHLKQTLSTCFP